MGSPERQPGLAWLGGKMSTETFKIEIPKLPQLDGEDVKAVRSFLPGKLLGRTAAFLSLVLLVLGFVLAIKISLDRFPDLAIPTWMYGMLMGLCFLAVVAQVVLEWRADRIRRLLQVLAVQPGAEQTGYFHIGPYQNTAEDRATFSRADQAEKKALEWIKRTTQVPLYLCGESGSGKSSLLNAFVLPMMREQGWTVVESRVWQDPQLALRDALLKLAGERRPTVENCGLREILENAAKQAPTGLLIVLDQFEEFVILAQPERQQEFAAFVAELGSRPVKDLKLLLVLRSEYQVPLQEIGLPLLRSGENLFQVGRFLFPAATAFMKGSGLNLQADAVDRLLTSAAELDETPGMVRPITLNVIGYVLASGKSVAPSLQAGVLIRRYIERTIEQPGIRDYAPQMLEQMITEQGTKRPRSEEELVADTKLRRAEVRAVLNGLDEAGLARPLDRKRAEWELSHDFVAHAVGRFLGRRRGQIVRQTAAYVAPALLAISLLSGVGLFVWNHFAPFQARAELAAYDVIVRPDSNGIVAQFTKNLNDEKWSSAAALLANVGPGLNLDLSRIRVANLEPLRGLKNLQRLAVRDASRITSLEPLKTLTNLKRLDLRGVTGIKDLGPLETLTNLEELSLSDATGITGLEPLKTLTKLQRLDLSRASRITSLEPLKTLTNLQRLSLLDAMGIKDLEPLKALTKLQLLDLTGAPDIISLEPLKTLTNLKRLDLLGATRITTLEPLKALANLEQLDLHGVTGIKDLQPLKALTKLQLLDLTGATGVDHLGPLKTLTNLRQLDLSGAIRIRDLGPLKTLTNLERLDLRDITGITDLAPLKTLTNLLMLDLTRASGVTSLESLKGLENKNVSIIGSSAEWMR
jgi:Leucine-rich repeat (LRR) protein